MRNVVWNANFKCYTDRFITGRKSKNVAGFIWSIISLFTLYLYLPFTRNSSMKNNNNNNKTKTKKANKLLMLFTKQTKGFTKWCYRFVHEMRDK